MSSFSETAVACHTSKGLPLVVVVAPGPWLELWDLYRNTFQALCWSYKASAYSERGEEAVDWSPSGVEGYKASTS